MQVVRLTAILSGVLREDVGQAQTKATVAAVHVPEVVTVRNLQAVLHPHNVQGRRACECPTLLSEQISDERCLNYGLEKENFKNYISFQIMCGTTCPRNDAVVRSCKHEGI